MERSADGSTRSEKAAMKEFICEAGQSENSRGAAAIPISPAPPSGLREAARTSDRRTHLLSKGKIVFQSSFMLMTIQALEWEARAFLNRIFTLLKWLTVSGRFV